MSAPETKIIGRPNFEGLEKLILKGDLSALNPAEKIQYYNGFCQRLGLDPFTKPFQILKLNGREVLYCDRSGTQQLSKLHSVSHEIKAREVINDCYVVTAQASTPDGRHTESIGAVPIATLKGEALCNAYMKAETKAKRRATLDLLGLGVLDESEIESIPVARTVDVSDWKEETGTGPISLEQRKALTDEAIARNIPTDQALAILNRFGAASTSKVTADKFQEVMSAFANWDMAPAAAIDIDAEPVDADPLIDVGSLWVSLQKSGDKAFSSKMKQLAHMIDWMVRHKYEVSSITSLSDVPVGQQSEYAKVLADIYAATQEKK